MMSGYRRVWLALACVVGVPGLLVSLVGQAVEINLVAAATVGVSVGAVVISGYDSGSRTAGTRAAVLAGGAGAVITLSVAGLCSLFGPNALLVALFFAVASPASPRGLMLLLRWPSRPGEPSRNHCPEVDDREPELPHLTSAPGAIHARTLSDEDLLRVWGASADVLDGLPDGDDPAHRLRHLRLRQQYLDEFERRHPETFARWLADGAPPSRGPADTLPRGDHGDDQSPRDRV